MEKEQPMHSLKCLLHVFSMTDAIHLSPRHLPREKNK